MNIETTSLAAGASQFCHYLLHKLENTWCEGGGGGRAALESWLGSYAVEARCRARRGEQEYQD